MPLKFARQLGINSLKKMEMPQQNSDSKSNNDKRSKWSSLFWCYFMSLMLMFLGFAWLKDIKTKGYYIDGKHQIAIAGKVGLVTVYALIVGGFFMLAYSIYSTLKSRRKRN